MRFKITEGIRFVLVTAVLQPISETLLYNWGKEEPLNYIIVCSLSLIWAKVAYMWCIRNEVDKLFIRLGSTFWGKQSNLLPSGRMVCVDWRWCRRLCTAPSTAAAVAESDHSVHNRFDDVKTRWCFLSLLTVADMSVKKHCHASDWAGVCVLASDCAC